MKSYFGRFVLMMIFVLSLSVTFVQSNVFAAAAADNETSERTAELLLFLKSARSEISGLTSMHFLNGNLAYKTELLRLLDVAITDIIKNKPPTRVGVESVTKVLSRMNGVAISKSPDGDDWIISDKIKPLFSSLNNAWNHIYYLTLPGYCVYGTVSLYTDNYIIAKNGATVELRNANTGTLVSSITTPSESYTGSYAFFIIKGGSYKIIAKYGIYKKIFLFTADGSWTVLNKNLIMR